MDKVTLANLALQLIGAKRIASFTEASAEGQAVSACYDQARDEVLGSHPWTFAQKRALLTQLGDPPVFTDDTLTIAYSHPSDALKINFFYPGSASVKLEADANGNKIICSDTKLLKVIYTFSNDQPSSYFAAFITALQYRLASLLAFTLSQSTAKSESLLEAYEKIYLPRAVSEDSQQGSPIELLQDDVLWARMAGTTTFPPNLPGAQTWHPPWL